MRRVVAGIVAVGACLLLLGSWPGAAQAPAPVKIGMLVPLTGVLTRNGRAAGDGTRLHLDEVGSDYVGGLEVNGSFTRVFCSLGGRVVQELWAPLGTPDFAPFITQIDRSADAVIVFAVGADGLRFGRQYPEYGVTLPLMDLYAQITDEANLAQFGDASLGWYSAIHYTALIDTPENKRFVAAWEKKYRRVPFDNAADGYVGARAIAEATRAYFFSQAATK